MQTSYYLVLFFIKGYVCLSTGAVNSELREAAARAAKSHHRTGSLSENNTQLE